jgi:3-hydroxymyristoyl/3-hydroxydecanoyl-(acyl carrier protein) dehydratase
MLRIFRGDLSLTEIMEMSPRDRDFMMQARIKNIERDKGSVEMEKELNKISP